MLNIVLFGPPGAGKGTQSEKLISAYHLVHLSTGDILRSEIAAGTESGMEAKKLMDAGFLVPDDVVIDMIRTKLDQNKDAKGFIFDGFPRTTAQAEALDRLLKEKNTEITLMLALEVNDAELIKRLLLRGKDSGRPDDVNEEIINKRIQEYNKKTAPLKEYYSGQSKFESVKGIGTIDEIFESLCSAINFVHSESTTSSKPVHEETVVEKITSFVKNVFSKKDEPEVPAVKKIISKKPAKVSPAKEETAASRKVPNTPAKKTGRTVVKKSPVKEAIKEVIKKVAAKKVTGKSKPVKKVVKKQAAKKVAPKKVVVKKVAAKKIAKKVVKKVAKKVASKKTINKTISKKAIKKVAPKKVIKKVVKKVAAKKVVKKIAAKKTAAKKVINKKAAKKVVKKTAPKKIAKKAPAKKVSAKKNVPKKAVKQNKKVVAKKAAKRKK